MLLVALDSTTLGSFLIRIAQVLVGMLLAPMAMAYIGPGSGISVIGSLLGLLATILLTVAAIALFPFRKMMKKRAQAKAAEGEEAEPADNAEPGETAPK